MKFDFCIGNPPYNEDFEKSGDNGNFAKPVYNIFMDEVFKIADKVELVHPARFLFNAGSTPKDWNEKMLNDPHFKVLEYEANSTKLFANADIKGGIAVTYRDSRKEFGEIGTFTAFPELNGINRRVNKERDERKLINIMYNQVNFDLDVLLTEHPEFISGIGSEGKDRRLEKNIFDKIPLFTEKKVHDDDVKILGVIKIKRQWRFIPRKYIDMSHENVNKFKVLVPRSNGSGAIGEVLSTPIVGEPIVGEPIVGYTRTFLGIGAFDTRNEADNCLKYVKSKFARTMLGILKITQDNPIDTWRLVPLQDFTPQSDIDWTKSISEIDRQLYKKYKLSPEEIQFIETHVKEMA